MAELAAVLWGAGFTIASCWACGRVLLAALRLRVTRTEELALGYVAGAGVLSFVVTLLALSGSARAEVFLPVGLAAIALAAFHRPPREADSRLPSPWDRLLPVAFAGVAGFLLLYALAPEFSPDGIGYRMGLVARYARDGGMQPVPHNFYAFLSQGVEMLFLFAFVFGKHSAAAVVHWAFLVALGLSLMAGGRRIGAPGAGSAAALFVMACPLMAVDAVSAYNDVAVASIAFALWLALEKWGQTRSFGWLPVAGMLAGFAYGAKYTAFPALLLALGWVARGRNAAAVAAVALPAGLWMAPWILRNLYWYQNPVAPFLNSLFENQYVFYSFEMDYRQQMRSYEGMVWHGIPWELAFEGGQLQGLIGPLILLTPLALLTLRSPSGRSLLAAGGLFLLPWFLNLGARFLLPTIPFVYLALASSLGRLAPAVAVVQVLLLWPPAVARYAEPSWALTGSVPVSAALRLTPEREWLDQQPAYRIARMVEEYVPPGAAVYAQNQLAEAYLTREIRVSYQSASGNVLSALLWTGLLEDWAPSAETRLAFDRQDVEGVRLVQTASHASDEWHVHELKAFAYGRELPREPHWRVRAQPNPWSVPDAFDHSPVTRWRAGRSLAPGQFLEVDFGGIVRLDALAVLAAPVQRSARYRLEVRDSTGWRPVEHQEAVVARSPRALRRAVTAEMLRKGIGYLLVEEGDFGAAEFIAAPGEWGLSPISSESGAVLYRIDPQ
ncbi:MAG: hypothetical protein IPM24_28065 [Bryobacterales bacterium]|nr:hypothetical protein [Bryobacterales bacterium]